jgi:hypothetical protein
VVTVLFCDVKCLPLSDQHGQKRTLWRILGRLADFEDERGNAEQGRAYRGCAEGIVEHITVNTGSETLATSFLARPDVVGILKG